ncbi:MAG: M20 family peptidase [Burkholderiaceae bacterium]
MRLLAKRIFQFCLAAVAALLLVLIVNTLRYSPTESVGSAPLPTRETVGSAAEKLAQSIRFQTVRAVDNPQPFERFIGWLEAAYPVVHQTLIRQNEGQLSLLYRWQGSDESLKPILLAAHYDVVPVRPETLDRWTHPPYKGVVADGFVWGRGTLDNKGAVIAICEAVERLVGAGFQPQRTVYLSFGHDEETGGERGAQATTELLKSQGVEPAWSLDEGSFVLDGIIAGLERPVASINVAEKGVLNLRLTVNSAGGHSSMPPRETAVGVLAAAIDRLQNAPVPGGLTGVTKTFFDSLARHFDFGRRMLFANQWLFGPLLSSVLSAEKTTNAVLRTTTAPTMLTGSTAPNVLPTQASAMVNFRLHPRDSIDQVIAFVRDTVADPRVELSQPTTYDSEASGESSHRAPGYRAIEASALASFGRVITVPGMTIAGTDSRYYTRIAQDAYRFNPFLIDRSDLARFHGIDERLSLENLARGITFYKTLLAGQ